MQLEECAQHTELSLGERAVSPEAHFFFPVAWARTDEASPRTIVVKHRHILYWHAARRKAQAVSIQLAS